MASIELTPKPLPGGPRRLRGRLGFLSSLMSGRARSHAERARESLKTNLAILKAQQDATLDGILVVDPEGKILSYNRRFTEIWGIPNEVAQRGDDAELLKYAFSAVAEWDEFIAKVEHLYAHPLESRADDTIELNDGRILSRSTVPVLAEGAVAGRAWYFRDITESHRAATLQAALFRISEMTHASKDLEDLYQRIHEIVGQLMDATNFYIAVYDGETNTVSYPYFVDQFDPRPTAGEPARGLTGYVLRTGNALLADPVAFQKLVEQGEVEDIGSPSVDWLGVPLCADDRVYGILGVQSYDESVRYGARERDILLFVSQHVANAIARRQHHEDLRESEQRYRQMFENNRAVKLLIDPTDGRILDANRAACDFYGYALEDLKQKSIKDINTLPPDEVSAEMQAVAAKKRSYFRFRHRLASGEIRDVEVHSGPLELRGKTLLFSIVNDVTERATAEQALRDSEKKYRFIVDLAPVAIYQSSWSGRVLTANTAMARMLGYDSPDELLKLDMGREVYFDPNERAALIEKHKERGSAADLEVRWRKRDGTPIWVQLSAHAITNRETERTYFEGFAFDITERKKAEQTLQKQSAAIETSIDGVTVLDDRGRVTYANDAFRRLFGYATRDEVLGERWTAFLEPSERRRFFVEILPEFTQNRGWRGETIGCKRNGLHFPQEISATAIGDGSTVCIVRDITERTYAEEQIKHLAYHDALTGLPNRLLFKDRLTVALSHAQRERRSVAVLFIDLDRFKVINDSLGHNVGDYLLQAVAGRIQSCLRESDTVARLGGDEFTILLSDLAKSDDAAYIARKILESVRLPFHISDRELYVTTSIGISLFPDDGLLAETLIKNADTAMYQAKELGRDNSQLFNATINAKALERLAVENGLRKAVINEEFVVYYQPIFDLRNGRIHGMEALLRWQHPTLGLIQPNDFIPVAEGTGLMVPIGLWALRTAAMQAQQWTLKGFNNLTLAVNLSVCQLQQPDLIERVKEVLEETGLPPKRIELEITESTAMQRPEQSIATLEELKKLGIRISLDDFGIGHSSLSYLKRFPIDTLKIDQSFVRDMTADPDTAAIVTAIIAMGHMLRLSVTAEGVETEAQRAFLTAHRCDQMQGFLFRPPLPTEEFETLLVEHNRAIHQWR
ncbi:MAG TPA: EAL domain-containing protein [Thermoanaerobaculia bacterium]